MEDKSRLRELSDSVRNNKMHISGVSRKREKKGQKVHLRKLELKISLIWGR